MLCALVAGVIAIAGAAAAGAFNGPGPVPKPKPLANAIHDALSAPTVTGVSADIQFTNHLIDTSGVRGASPLLTGASGRLWATRDALRIELQSTGGEGAGDVQVLVRNGVASVYDAGTSTLYRATLPAGDHTAKKKAKKKSEGVPTVAQISTELGKLAKHLAISGAAPGDVNRQPAYTVTVSPKQHGGLIGAAQLAWDSRNGIPLRIALYAHGDSTPVLELVASNVRFGAQPASVFALGTPPKGTKVVNLTHRSSTATHAKNKKKGHQSVTGVAAVQSKLPFKLSAPPTLAGRQQSEVSLIGEGSDAGALVTYGEGLDGLAVIEQKASGKSSAPSITAGSGRRHSQLQFPSFTVAPGVTGNVLTTPIGTVVRFERGGIAYTVLGSVTSSTAETAAQGL